MWKWVAGAALVALVLAGWCWSRPTPPPASEVGTGPKRMEEPRLSTDPSFRVYPQAHQPAAVKAALGNLQGWADSQYPELQVKVLEVDCSKAPCLIGLTYSVAQDPAALWPFQHAARAEIERRLGWTLGTIHMDEDAHKRQHLWMWGLPEELTLDPEQGPKITQEAEDRYTLKVLGVKPPIEPAAVQVGEEDFPR